MAGTVSDKTSRNREALKRYSPDTPGFYSFIEGWEAAQSQPVTQAMIAAAEAAYRDGLFRQRADERGLAMPAAIDAALSVQRKEKQCG